MIAALLVALAGAGAAAGASAGGVVLVLVLLLPVSELAVGLVNQLLTLFMPPRVLPKLDFKDGIPADCATFIVMPTMLVRPQSAAVLLERLEIHYLANPDPQFRFALLTDFADAPRADMPEDEGYVARRARRRQGAQRALLCRGTRTGSSCSIAAGSGTRCRAAGWAGSGSGASSRSSTACSGATGDELRLAERRPGGAEADPVRDHARRRHAVAPRRARRLVGTLAHPLNSPRFDPAHGRVVEGYGVLQPRVSFHLVAATRSRFAALLAASGGIDPYSTAVSDIYMDLFGLGSFTGKGIYDVDAFEAATGRPSPRTRSSATT